MKNTKYLRKIVSLALLISILSACTEPGDTTYVGSATGGVIGAGLGAIIGNQTGDAGGGLAIGAVAGAGAGAAIGNALEAQQKSIRTQDEAIERQQKILAAQNAEIQELRGTPTDSISRNNYDSTSEIRGSLSRDASLTEQLNSGSGNAGSAYSMNAPRDRAQLSGAPSGSALIEKSRIEREGPTADSLNRGSAAIKESDLTTSPALEKADTTARLTADSSSPEGAECQKAQGEIQKAESAKEGADKLFYLRRAIRLCPSKAVYHKNLADQYLSLGRNEDAKAAYADALRLDPTMTEAGEAMSAISSNNIY